MRSALPTGPEGRNEDITTCWFMLQVVTACNGRLHAHQRQPSQGLEAETLATRSKAFCYRGGELTVQRVRPHAPPPYATKRTCFPTEMRTFRPIICPQISANIPVQTTE
jgi:hypothetical protein